MRLKNCIFLFVVLIFTSCSIFEEPQLNKDETKELRTISFDIPFQTGSKFSMLADSAIVQVIKDETIIIESSLEIGDSSLTGLVEQIPAGESYLFSILVFDVEKDVVYKGASTAEILSGKTVEVNIDITAVNGSAIIKGKIIEDVPKDTLPVLQMPLTVDVKDESQYLHGCINTDVVFTSDEMDIEGALFNGNSSYVTVEADTLLNIGDKSFTVSFWLKAGIQDAPIVSKYRGGIGSPEVGWNIQCENNEHGTGVRFDMSDGRNGRTGLLATGLSALDNEWHHFVVVVNRGANIAQIFMDNREVDSEDITNIGSAKTLEEIILGWRGDYWVHLDGVLANLKIYNSALTLEQVTGLYNKNENLDIMPVLDVPLKGDFKDVSNNAFILTPKDIEFEKGYSSALFNGSTSYLSIDDSEVLNVGDSSFSVAFWLKAGVQDSPILSKYRGGVGTPEQGWNIQCENNLYGTGVRFDISDGQNGKTGLIASGLEATDNTWHHITIIVNRMSKKAEIYLDGVLKDSSDISMLGSVKTNSNLIVGWRGDYWNYYNGQLRNLRIYQYALSGVDILNLITQ